MAIREGMWDCGYCNSKGIRGGVKICPNCARPRGDDVKFYLAENAQAITDEAQLKVANQGPDWHCEYCGSDNSADMEKCKQCGGARGGAKAREVHIVGQEKPAQPPVTPPPAAPKKPKRWRWKIIAAAIVALVAFLIFHTKEEKLTVTGVTWERSIAVERYQTVREEDWSIPTGGRKISSKKKFHHNNKVLDHYETRTHTESYQDQVGSETYVCGQRDKGNGYFEDVECTRPVYESKTREVTSREPVYRDVPVDQTWYTYDIEKWLKDRDYKLNGADLEPKWPEAKLADQERECCKQEAYGATFEDADDKTYTKTLPFAAWSALQIGGECKGTMNTFGTLLEVDCSPDAK